MKSTAPLSAVLVLFLAVSLPAQHALAHGMESNTSAQAAGAQATGVVDEVDAPKGVVTISHEPVQSLGWPAMTMDFVVKDKKILGRMAKGKKIHFTFVEKRGDYLITKIE